MKGRLLGILLAGVLVVALGFQARRWHDRMLAGRLLRQVEVVTLNALTTGKAPANIAAVHLELLRQAARLDPTEVGVPIARGSQFLLFGSPQAAITAYREALALEPRPEIYLDLGRAYKAIGEAAEAEKNFAIAARLDPALAAQVAR